MDIRYELRLLKDALHQQAGSIAYVKTPHHALKLIAKGVAEETDNTWAEHDAQTRGLIAGLKYPPRDEPEATEATSDEQKPAAKKAAKKTTRNKVVKSAQNKRTKGEGE